ncbi:MAG TPA: hypothetical protein V6C97_14390, partial [Oculatellaceae cyanobacterium]
EVLSLVASSCFSDFIISILFAGSGIESLLRQNGDRYSLIELAAAECASGHHCANKEVQLECGAGSFALPGATQCTPVRPFFFFRFFFLRSLIFRFH